MNYQVRNIELSDLDEVLAFCDQWIGKGYFKKDELRALLIQGVEGDLNPSFLAHNDDKLIAIRITLAPYEWTKVPELKPYINPYMWKVPNKKVAYFKSLFVAKNYQQKGIGSDLTKRSLEILYKMGCMAVVCHSWIESPGNSSQIYLKRLGFESVATHKDFWMFKEYNCTRCGDKACKCSAEEMIYYFPLEEEL